MIKKNILVTGAEGFVGKNTVEILSKNQNFRILSPKIELLDLVHYDNVLNYLERNEVDIIIHCATHNPEGKIYSENVCEKNLRMFFNLIRYVEKHRETKFINLGSGSEYSREYWLPKMQENFFDTHVPQDGHSFSKYVISKYIEMAKNELNLISLRIFGVYGKYEDFRYKFISNTIAKNLLNIPIKIVKNAVYDYIYIDDLVNIIEYFVSNEENRGSYNVTPNNSISLLDIVSIINDKSYNRVDVSVLADGIGINYTGSNSLLLEKIPQFEFLSYEKGIEKLIRYYEAIDLASYRSEIQNEDYINYAIKINSLNNDAYKK